MYLVIFLDFMVALVVYFKHMNIYKVLKNKAFLQIQTRNFNTTTFEIDRDDVGWLAEYNWQLRSNGTAICSYNKIAMTHILYERYNGYFPKKVKHLDGNTTNCKIKNLACYT